MSVNNENSPNTPEAGAANKTPASQKSKSRQVPKDFKPLKPVEIDTSSEIDYDTETWDVIKSYFDINRNYLLLFPLLSAQLALVDLNP